MWHVHALPSPHVMYCRLTVYRGMLYANILEVSLNIKHEIYTVVLVLFRGIQDKIN